MTLSKPKAIGPGSMLGILSPASLAKAELVHRGIESLEQLGYRTRLMPHALDRGPLNYAGALEDRLADLHTAYADQEIDAILCTRGGWGCAELLPHLDRRLIQANNKALLGYSDLTSLHVWLQREMGRVSFQAPMVASDFAKDAGAPDLGTWASALTQTAPWTLGAEAGLRVLRPGSASGVLSGGCISIYAEALGTEFSAEARGGVLFLEDVGTKPYQWNRLLLHLRYAGLLDGVQGILFGDMHECVPPEEHALLEETLLYALRDFDGPIGIGLRSGHVARANITLPFGVEVLLEFEDVTNPRMHFCRSRRRRRRARLHPLSGTGSQGGGDADPHRSSAGHQTPTDGRRLLCDLQPAERRPRGHPQGTDHRHRRQDPIHRRRRIPPRRPRAGDRLRRHHRRALGHRYQGGWMG